MNKDFEILRTLLLHDRSVRRFSNRRISDDTLLSLVELTRYCASGRNIQPLRYRCVSSPEECDAVFPMLAWAGYLTDWPGPEEGERPTAYLVQCLDTEISANCLCDDGLHLQAITLGACALGIGACIIKSFPAEQLAATLDIPSTCKPVYVLALGYPTETPEIVDMIDGDYKYYRTPDGRHIVPKRQLKNLIIS